jgi:hypothetical protein
MPKGIKPTKWKGNKNSGRKTKAEEIRGAIEKVTSEALIELANSKVYKQLQRIDDANLSGFKDTQAMALPITLKGITEKIETKEKVIITFDNALNSALKSEKSNPKSDQI